MRAARVRHARAVLVDCNLSEAALGWIFGHAHADAVFAEPVSAFKCRRLLPWLGQVHTLKANRLEAQALTGLPVADDAGLVQAARWLHDQGVLHVVLSLGERGVYWSARDGASGWQSGVAGDHGQCHWRRRRHDGRAAPWPSERMTLWTRPSPLPVAAPP